MTRKALLLGVAFLVGLSAGAQEFPKAEVAAMYSYSRFSPSPHYTPNLNLNGGGGAITVNVNSCFGIKAEFTGYAGSQATFRIPAGNPIAPTGAIVKGDANLFTYLFGPQIKVRAHKYQPYVHFLFGGAHSTVYANAETACANICNPIAPTTGTGHPSQNAFAMAIGGGLDIPLNRRIALRVGQFDFLMTRFANRWDTDNQHNFRYSAGFVFNFGQ